MGFKNFKEESKSTNWANKIFRQVLCSDRLPETKTETYLTEVGAATLYSDNKWLSMVNKQPEWWLEEVELPSDEEIEEIIDNLLIERGEHFSRVRNPLYGEERILAHNTFNKATELIKGEGLNNPTTN